MTLVDPLRSLAGRACALALLAGVACATGDAGSAAGGGAAIRPASEFALSDYAGKVLVVNFWATWCGPCRLEIPDLVKLRGQFRPGQVAIVGISLDAGGNPDQLHGLLKEFIARYGINYPVFLDPDQKVAAEFDRKASFRPFVPATLLFDQKGVVRGKHLGVPRNPKGQLDPYGVLHPQIQGLLDGA